jgi:hypothetical protein
MGFVKQLQTWGAPFLRQSVISGDYNMRNAKVGFRGWNIKDVAAITCFVLFLAIQIGVPLVKLRAPGPAPFGWHMFAAIPTRPKFSVVMRDGTIREVDPLRYFGERRGDMDFQRALPPHLCSTMDIAAVQILFPGSERSQVYTCR